MMREEVQKVKHGGGQQEAVVLPRETGRRHGAWEGGVRELGEVPKVEQWVRCEKGHPKTRTQPSTEPGQEGRGPRHG